MSAVILLNPSSHALNFPLVFSLSSGKIVFYFFVFYSKFSLGNIVNEGHINSYEVFKQPTKNGYRAGFINKIKGIVLFFGIKKNCAGNESNY